MLPSASRVGFEVYDASGDGELNKSVRCVRKRVSLDEGRGSKGGGQHGHPDFTDGYTNATAHTR